MNVINHIMIPENEIIGNIKNNLSRILGDYYERFFGLINTTENAYITGPLIVKSIYGEEYDIIDVYIIAEGNMVNRWSTLRNSFNKHKDSQNKKLNVYATVPNRIRNKMFIETVCDEQYYSILKNIFTIDDGVCRLQLFYPMDIEKRIATAPRGINVADIASANYRPIRKIGELYMTQGKHNSNFVNNMNIAVTPVDPIKDKLKWYQRLYKYICSFFG